MIFDLRPPIHKLDNNKLKLLSLGAFRNVMYAVRTNTVDRDGTLSACVVEGISENSVMPVRVDQICRFPQYYGNVTRLRNVAEMFALSRESMERRVIAMNRYMSNPNHDNFDSNLYGCMAAGIILKDSFLQMFNIGKTNVMLVTKDGRIIASHLTNQFNSSTRGTGALNGDYHALQSVNISYLDLGQPRNKEIYMIMLYTEGNSNVLFNDDMRKKIIAGYYPRVNSHESMLLTFQKRLELPNQHHIK